MAIRFFALVCLFVCSPILLADDLRLLQQAKAYLADPSEKLAESLVGYQGNVDEIIEALRAQMPRDWRKVTGILDAEHFEHPELKNTYKEDLLYFYVPDDYDGSEPFALMIFLHGGGEGTKREHAQAITALPEQFKYSYDLRRYVEDIPVITVAPSAPVAKTSARWCTVEAERYLVDVIRECHFRFNVDIDRVFLGGTRWVGWGPFIFANDFQIGLPGASFQPDVGQRPIGHVWQALPWSSVTEPPTPLRPAHRISTLGPVTRTCSLRGRHTHC